MTTHELHPRSCATCQEPQTIHCHRQSAPPSLLVETRFIGQSHRSTTCVDYWRRRTDTPMTPRHDGARRNCAYRNPSSLLSTRNQRHGFCRHRKCETGKENRPALFTAIHISVSSSATIWPDIPDHTLTLGGYWDYYDRTTSEMRGPSSRIQIG
jgi:hypothetical protein